jgi:primosomal protein N' (replication factor Y)
MIPAYHERRPSIHIVDRKDISHFKRNPNMSDELLSALSETLENKRQSLVYLNRRGSATYILCANCGWSARCPKCDIGLVLHHDSDELRCHQCGYRSSVINECPECGHPEIRFRGAGTKRVEADLNRLFPEARIARFDSDSAKGGRLHEQYDKLYNGAVDIIIGTQAVARSLDLPLLDTVGVVSADSELLLPDFSASERAFQLLYQVIGRVGRTTGRGNVFIQTHDSNHPAIQFATRHDYEGFYEYELSHRQAFGYPPFSHLLALVTSYRSRVKAQDAALKMATELRREKGLQVLGPAPAFYERRGNNYRWLVIVKSKQRHRLLMVANRVRSPHWQVDLDPNNLLF